MRGDRPSTFAKWKRTRRATPHARGSTTASRHHIRGANGYPACAGIDPGEGESRRTGTGLPRMRGDRPDAKGGWHGMDAATPHARGSTSSTHPSAVSTQGYPACAGIDPRLRYHLSNSPRLPRMRGDRPVSPPIAMMITAATPHARGSTPSIVVGKKVGPGYPACAGIDLSDVLMSPSKARLPRMRGDRPHLGFSKV